MIVKPVNSKVLTVLAVKPMLCGVTIEVADEKAEPSDAFKISIEADTELFALKLNLIVSKSPLININAESAVGDAEVSDVLVCELK